MKPMLTTTLVVLALSIFSGPSRAQTEDQQASTAPTTTAPSGAEARSTVKSSKSNSSDRAAQGEAGEEPGAQATTTIKSSKSNSSERKQAGLHAAGSASAQSMTGKVVKVDAMAKTFTILSHGKEVGFSAAKLNQPLPSVGAVIDIRYTQTPGGPLESINLNSSRSNSY